ncbi:Pol polyprotein [Thelohanellus kitauei]|uniref:Pol polyprotein n=1 Tax=Thelohanellus kitauei TaxID=669202 RepID=A0A0C2N6A7_THEKT|nr:Pol polyprotein [Thelohanellus kitauei]
MNRADITFEDNVLLLNTGYPRVLIPKKLRTEFFKIVHKGQWCIFKAKQLSRRYCSWPEIDRGIENMICSCAAWAKNSISQTNEFTNWPEASGPLKGSMSTSSDLSRVDAFSRFLFVVKMNNITTQQTISVLKSIFSIEGFPMALVSDNGRQITSSEFENFCNSKVIEHLFSAPYLPQSNGLAERFVQSLKLFNLKIA